MSTTTTPNMNLVVPNVGNQDGPQWAQDINNCFNTVDAHDHTSGNGVQITPDGMSISSDLPINDNNILSPKSIRFFAQSSPLAGGADIGCIYESGVDLYYNDGNGNQVRITNSGSVAGSPGSIGSLASPASATYVSGSQTFVWQSDANVPANLDAGSVIIRNITASSKGITLSAPNALGSDYSIILPALPVATSAMNLTSSGTMGTITYDAIGQAMTATGANAIANTRTRATGTTVAVGGVAISASSGAFSTASATPVDVTNLSVTITNSSRPIMILVVPDEAAAALSYFGVQASGATSHAKVYLLRDVTTIATCDITHNVTGVSGLTLLMPPSLSQLQAVSAGTYTFKVQLQLLAGTGAFINSCKLIAYEI